MLDLHVQRCLPLPVQLQPTTPVAPKSNPFGNAKPVDVSARLKELDERDAKRKVHPDTIARALFYGRGGAAQLASLLLY